jgi:(2Fe-2S) ferredoxin
MAYFKKHIFICTNLREKDPDSSCAPKGGEEVHKRLKKRLKEMGMSHEVRANKSGCLDACKHGVSLVIYPDNVWYGHVTVDDVDEIIDKTILNNHIIKRLVIPRKSDS